MRLQKEIKPKKSVRCIKNIKETSICFVSFLFVSYFGLHVDLIVVFYQE